MANSEKFKSLAENDAFLEKLISAKTDEELKSVFKEQDVEISDKEIENLKKSFQQKMSEELKKLPENQLSEIAGGTLKNVVNKGIKSALTGLGFGVLVGGIAATAKLAKNDEKVGDLLMMVAKCAAASTLVGGATGAIWAIDPPTIK